MYGKFSDIFGQKLVPISVYNTYDTLSNQIEMNWFELKTKLIKTRSCLPFCKTECKKNDIKEIFPDNKFDTLQKYKKRKIRFSKKAYNFPEYDDLMDDLASGIIIMKRSILK